MPKMNRQSPFKNIIVQAHDLTLLSSPTPSYSFHGSNSSHSKDSGQGGRTYHVPNYATRHVRTSYANEKTHLISVTFDEDKGATKTIVTIVFMFLLLFLSSAYILARGLERSFLVFRTPGALEPHEVIDPPIQLGEDVSPPAVAPTGKAVSSQWIADEKDEKAVGDEVGIPDRTSPSSGLYWDELQGNIHCIAYGTRRYTARLRNVPFWANRTRACLETPAQINGVILTSPDECEVNWPMGRVKGRWDVNFKENDCTPVWGKFTDKGCTEKGSHKRLFRARLWNVKKGENRILLCKTAPAHVAGTFRSRPDSCEDKGIWGTYGIWMLEDTKC